MRKLFLQMVSLSIVLLVGFNSATLISAPPPTITGCSPCCAYDYPGRYIYAVQYSGQDEMSQVLTYGELPMTQAICNIVQGQQCASVPTLPATSCTWTAPNKAPNPLPSPAACTVCCPYKNPSNYAFAIQQSTKDPSWTIVSTYGSEVINSLALCEAVQPVRCVGIQSYDKSCPFTPVVPPSNNPTQACSACTLYEATGSYFYGNNGYDATNGLWNSCVSSSEGMLMTLAECQASQATACPTVSTVPAPSSNLGHTGCIAPLCPSYVPSVGPDTCSACTPQADGTYIFWKGFIGSEANGAGAPKWQNCEHYYDVWHSPKKSEPMANLADCQATQQWKNCNPVLTQSVSETIDCAPSSKDCPLPSSSSPSPSLGSKAPKPAPKPKAPMEKPVVGQKK